MDKKIIIAVIIIFLAIVGGLFFVERTKEPATDQVFEEKEAEKIAEQWIINNSPTYVFDGFNLSLVSKEEILEGEKYSFIFSFESRAAGYGDRADEMLAQVITPHTMEVVVKEGEAISAVTDEIYDELQAEMTEKDQLEIIKIKVYFVQVVEGQEEFIETEREIPYTLAVGRAAIEELLKGPSPEKQAEGLSSAINEGTRLQRLEIEDGLAKADFNERLQEGVAGSAWVMAIRGQIEKTLLQFATVDQVVISINGQTEDILQP